MLGKFNPESVDNPDGTPVRLVLEGAWVPRAQPATRVPGQKADSYAATQVITMPTSLERADARTEALCREAQRLMEAGQIGRLWRLLEANPELGLDPRAEKLIRRALDSGQLHRDRGRPPRSYTISPPTVYALVHAVIASGRAANIDRALRWLTNEEVLPLSYGAAKTKYYQVLEEPRFRGLLVRRPGVDMPNAGDVKELVARSRRLEPGSETTVEARSADPAAPPLKVTFKAFD